MTILSLDRVSKSYGALKVTDDISLSVAHGETLGIIGPNGAGKTTLFNLISGDEHVDHGRIVFAEQEITALRPHARTQIPGVSHVQARGSVAIRTAMPASTVPMR